MDRGRGKVGKGGTINLEDIDDVGTVGEGDVINDKAPEANVEEEVQVRLVRGKVNELPTEEDSDFTDLEQLKKLKVLTEDNYEVEEEVAEIPDLDGAIARQLAVMESMQEVVDDLAEEEDRVNDISVVDDDEEDDAEEGMVEDDEVEDYNDEDDYDDEDDGVEVKKVSIRSTFESEEDDYDDDELTTGLVDEDEELLNARRMKKAEEDGVKMGTASKSANSKNIKDGKGNVKKKTQARVQGNLARLRNAVNMAGAYHDTYLPKSNLIFRAYKPTNSIALDNRTIRGDWVTAGRDRLRATLKEFYENGVLRCAENVSFEVFLRSISYRDLKYINCGIASTIVDKWEMDIGLCKHVDADGPCTKSKETEIIVLPIKDIIQKSYKAEELERLKKYDNTKTISELQADTLFGQCEVYGIDIHNNNGDRTGTMKVYTCEASVERYLSVMRAVDDYLISILVEERPDMRAIAGNLNTDELLYQVKEIMPERSQEAYGVALVMLGIDKLEVGTEGENKVVEFKVEDVRSYEELFELFTIIDSKIMARLGSEEKTQDIMDINSFKIKYRRKCKHLTVVNIESELVLNLPRRVLSV